jgi:hypothetical protein
MKAQTNINHSFSFASPTTDRLNASQNQSNTSFVQSPNENEVWLSKPADWSDDVRMNALFAPFRNRDLNPLHYDNKLKFWKQTIRDYCYEKQVLQFNMHQLEMFFVRKNVRPKCLEMVVNEMLREKSIVAKEEALRPKEGLVKNVFNKLVWSPLAWSASYLLRPLAFASPFADSGSAHHQTSTGALTTGTKSSSSAPSLDHLTSIGLKDENKFFVFANLLEQKSQEFLKSLQENVVYNNVESVIELEQLHTLAENTSDFDLDLMVKFLQANQKILIDDKAMEGKRLLKFSLKSNVNVEPINEMELSFIG